VHVVQRRAAVGILERADDHLTRRDE